MNVINVVKPLQITVISIDIKEHILDGNLINAVNVVKSFHITLFSKDLKEHILERNLMNVINVIKSLHSTVVSNRRVPEQRNGVCVWGAD